MNRDIFRAYDIRGVFGVDFQPTDFYQIARAFANRFRPKIVALGYDVRESSPLLFQSVAEGLIDSGVEDPQPWSDFDRYALFRCRALPDRWWHHHLGIS